MIKKIMLSCNKDTAKGAVAVELALVCVIIFPIFFLLLELLFMYLNFNLIRSGLLSAAPNLKVAPFKRLQMAIIKDRITRFNSAMIDPSSIRISIRYFSSLSAMTGVQAGQNNKTSYPIARFMVEYSYRFVTPGALLLFKVLPEPKVKEVMYVRMEKK